MLAPCRLGQLVCTPPHSAGWTLSDARCRWHSRWIRLACEGHARQQPPLQAPWSSCIACLHHTALQLTSSMHISTEERQTSGLRGDHRPAVTADRTSRPVLATARTCKLHTPGATCRRDSVPVPACLALPTVLWRISIRTRWQAMHHKLLTNPGRQNRSDSKPGVGALLEAPHALH